MAVLSIIPGAMAILRRILGATAMKVSMKRMSFVVAAFGILSFISGIVAERTKPTSGFPLVLRDSVICKYPTDPSVYLGFFSIATCMASALLGCYSIYYPYNGKAIPLPELFKSYNLIVYIQIAVLVSLAGGGMLMWATFTELILLTGNVHHSMDVKCATAETGAFGGGAFLALNASLFWLLCLMLANNARADYLEDDEALKGDYGQVYAPEYGANEQATV